MGRGRHRMPRDLDRYTFVQEYNVRELADLLTSIGEELERRGRDVIGGGAMALGRMLRGDSGRTLGDHLRPPTENPRRTPSLVDLVRRRARPDASPQ